MILTVAFILLAVLLLPVVLDLLAFIVADARDARREVKRELRFALLTWGVLLAVAMAAVLSGCQGGDVAVSQQQTAGPPLVLIGDSITYLWNDPAWPSMTSADLITTRLPGAVDKGISGQTCEQMAARFDADVLALHPQVIHIMCGTNDVFRLRSTDSQVFEWDMVQKAVASGARVIVGMMPPDAYVDDVQRQVHAEWNANVVAGASAYGYSVADYYDPMMLPNGVRNTALFATGSAHPVAAGYAVMWDVLRPLL